MTRPSSSMATDMKKWTIMTVYCVSFYEGSLSRVSVSFTGSVVDPFAIFGGISFKLRENAINIFIIIELQVVYKIWFNRWAFLWTN